MKKIIGITLSSLILTGTALANAGPAPCPACAPAPVAKWSGLKAGAGVGFSAPSSKYSLSGTIFGNRAVVGTNHGRASFSGGPTLGYFANLNANWLLGCEAGAYFSNMNARTRSDDTLAGGISQGLRVSTHATMFVVPQIAYIVGDSKFHFGLGWAGAKWKTHNYLEDCFTYSTNTFKSALRISVGAAQKFNKYSLGIEATYDWFGSISKTDVDAALALNSHQSTKPRVLSFLLKWCYDLDGMF